MKKQISVLLCGALLTGLLAGCGGTENKVEEKKEETPATTETTSEVKEEKKEETKTEDTKSEPVNIKVWHDGDESIIGVIQGRVNDTLASDNVSVSFEKKTGLSDQIKLYGNDADNGPDMYFYAHDSLGMFVEMGVLSPITDVIDPSVYADLLPMTVQAGNYKGEQYLMPVYFETLLFMYNKALWKVEIPSTTEDLYNYMVANTDVDAGTYALVNQHSTAYNVAPYINGFGGYIINADAKSGLNLDETKQAIEYNQKFAALEADGDYNTITTLFNEGKAAAIIGGPWLIGGIKEAGIDLGIKSLSDITLPNGNALAPYSGVQGIGIMKHSVDTKKDVIAKVLQAIADPGLGVELANKANCAPANQKAYDDASVSSNEMVAAIGHTASTAQPMPNIPEMGVMWGPTEALLAAVNKSGEDLTKAADQYQKEAETAIADMQ